jgi:hypothetical protein
MKTKAAPVISKSALTALEATALVHLLHFSTYYNPLLLLVRMLWYH